MVQVITGQKQLLLCREKTKGTSNEISTATGNATTASRWADTGFNTTLIDGTLEDGTYFEDGYYLMPLTGTAANIGIVKAVSSWVTADDEFAVASAWPATPQSADTAMLFKVGRTNVGTNKATRAKKTRDYQTLGFTKPSPVNGKPEGDVEFTSEFISHLTDGPMHELMLSTMGSELQSADSSIVITGSASASDVWITDGESTKGIVTGLVAVEVTSGNWEFGAITAIDASDGAKDILTVAPALSAVPTAGNAVKFMRCYQDAETGQISLTLIVQDNAERWTYTGCVGNVALSELNTGNIPELNFTYKADNYTRTTGALPGNVQLPDIEPPCNFGGMARINGSDYEMFKVSADLGNNITEKPIFEGATGRKEFGKVNHEIKASFGIFNNAAATVAEFDLYDNNTTADIFVVSGSPANSAGAIAIRLPTCKIDDASKGDEDGRGTWDMEASLFDNETDATISRRMVFGYTT